MEYGMIGYERVTEAMVFGTHYIIDEKDKWIKHFKNYDFFEKYLPKRKKENN